MYMHTCVYVYVYVYVYIYIYIYIQVCMYIYIYICMYRCIYIYIYREREREKLILLMFILPLPIHIHIYIYVSESTGSPLPLDPVGPASTAERFAIQTRPTAKTLPIALLYSTIKTALLALAFDSSPLPVDLLLNALTVDLDVRIHPTCRQLLWPMGLDDGLSCERDAVTCLHREQIIHDSWMRFV